MTREWEEGCAFRGRQGEGYNDKDDRSRWESSENQTSEL